MNNNSINEVDIKQYRSENRYTNLIGLLRFCAFFVVFAVVFFRLQYLLASDENSYTRVMEHEMYNPEKNIDTLFVGSSHTYRQYIPSIIDGYLNGYSFNVGSSSQHLDAGLALLIEVGKTNKLKTVFVELCPAYKGEVYSERTSFVETYIIGDYMKWGLNKFDFLLHASSDRYYVNSFFPLLRNKEFYYDYEYIKNAIELKSNEDYLQYLHPGNREIDVEWYEDRGYVANNEVVEYENWSLTEGFEPIKECLFSNDELKTLNRIVSYCKKNDIRLVFIATPLTDFNLSLYGNYDNGREQIASFARDNNVEFYDFNLCKPEYFTYESTKFKDKSHMNCFGAEEYSHLIGKFFSGQIKEEDLFYNSYKEKTEAMGNKVFGLLYNVENTESEKVIHIVPVSSSNFVVYANIKKTDGESEHTILNKGVLEDLHLEKDELGEMIFEILGDNPDGDISNIITIDY